ncbi:MAG: ATPase [Mesorhizobium sp.]|nr:ATP12 family protein [Mesorhizobium sp.]MCO5163736.1 ATPase [Mesorhizobium sp.]
MRDILEDLEAGRLLSDPDPIRRAQIQSKMPLPKRFYDQVSVGEREGGYAVLLDGKPVRTPGRALLILPTEEVARLVADEFAAQESEIDPVKMPVTRIANSAVDGVAKEPQAVAEDIVKYAGTDLLLYRADSPQALVERQAAAWDPVLDWARREIGARFILAEGVMHVAQPAGSIEAVRRHVASRGEPLRFAAMHVMTTLTGSALLALAVDAGALGADAAWNAAHVDEDWNIEQWGTDAEAQARRAFRKADMLAAARVISALL